MKLLKFGNLEHILENQQSIFLQMLLDSPKLRNLLDILDTSEDNAMIIAIETADNKQDAIDITSLRFNVYVKEIVEYIYEISSSELEDKSKLTEEEFFLLNKVHKQCCYVGNLLTELKFFLGRNNEHK